MERTFVIDYLPESAAQYGRGWAVVAVDVIRATTTAITAVATGRRCFPAPTVFAAVKIARQFDNALLAGESGGDIPPGFDIDNSPAILASRRDTHRPLVFMSSSGTKVVDNAASADAVYLGCFRNHSALPKYLAGRHPRIAIIGAGSKGEFREEDQACCAWIGAALMTRGYLPQDARSAVIAARWRDKPAHACLVSQSVAFLKRTGRLADISFIFSHINDLSQIFTVQRGEVLMSPPLIAAPNLNLSVRDRWRESGIVNSEF